MSGHSGYSTFKSPKGGDRRIAKCFWLACMIYFIKPRDLEICSEGLPPIAYYVLTGTR